MRYAPTMLNLQIPIAGGLGRTYVRPGVLDRDRRHNDALAGAAYHGALGNAECQTHAIADAMHCSYSGEGWTMWWRALVTLSQSLVDTWPQCDAWCESPEVHPAGACVFAEA